MNSLDWNLARAFHATAEKGSLTAAAAALGLSQPTLSRQVAALEENLGVALFERIGKRLVLTDVGAELLVHVRSMHDAADALALTATGRSQSVEGLVSISASEGIAALLLPSMLGRIRSAAPGLTIEVIASNALSDLRRREADIAIRHVAPAEEELIGRRIRDDTAHFYASRAWVERHGRPQTWDDARGLDFIGFDRDGRFKEYLEQIGLPVKDLHFPVLSENSLVGWQMARQGLGITIMMREIGDATPDVVRVLESVPGFDFPIWLVTHRELRTARRIRVVFDLLAEALQTEREVGPVGGQVY